MDLSIIDGIQVQLAVFEWGWIAMAIGGIVSTFLQGKQAKEQMRLAAEQEPIPLPPTL
ncbi:hypothetical protein LCGC14_2725390 [marine sediment metagenome]|uniref:Uncharacterized protein n=1 Tax=marine sediment metagenome TaxID=412755 RepID=A0A0F8ZWC2_9ZZZZ